MSKFEEKNMGNKYNFADLDLILDRLLAEDGCPWDREQTHESLRRNLIEEAYEVLEAIDDKNPAGLSEELGDLLLQIVFHSKLAEKAGQFSIDDVTDGICRKLIRRHPHVFGDIKVANAAEVNLNWEAIKKEERAKEAARALDRKSEVESGQDFPEKGFSPSILAGIPKNLPSLLEAWKIQKKVEKVAFDWEEISQVFDKLHEEENELLEAMANSDKEAMEEEFGDLLFTLVSIGRFLDIEAEGALFKANNKFRRRFSYIEAGFEEKSLELVKKNRKMMEKLWKESKKNV